MDLIRVAKGDREAGKRPPLVLPSHIIDESVLLSDEARTGGILLAAPTGWGKSWYLGSLCFVDLERGVGTVVLDAVGAAIDNLLNKLLYLPEEEQKELSEKSSTAIWPGIRWGTQFTTHMCLPGQCFTNWIKKRLWTLHPSELLISFQKPIKH